MRELLQRWHAHEPDRCGQLLEDPGWPALSARRLLALGGKHYSCYLPDGPLSGSLLLAAVIEAVTARDWFIDLEIGQDGTIAGVTRLPIELDRIHTTTSTIEPPASVLLRAYLKALEAEAAA